MSDYVKEHLVKESRFFGKYRGVVKSLKDPKKLGRIQVYVPDVHGADVYEGGAAISGWAFPVHIVADACLPKVGDFVWVEFESGNRELPLWQLGAFLYNKVDGSLAPKNFIGEYGREDNTGRDSNDFATSQFLSEYGNTRTLKHGNNTIQLESGDNDRILIQHESGSRIEMLNDGSVVVYARGNITQVVDGQVKETHHGAVTIKNKDTVTTTNSNDVTETTLKNLTQTVSGNTNLIYTDVSEIARNKSIILDGSYQLTSAGDASLSSVGELTLMALETIRLLTTGAKIPTSPTLPTILPIPPISSFELTAVNPSAGIRLNNVSSELYLGLGQLLMSCLTQIVLQAPIVNINAPIVNNVGIFNQGVAPTPAAKAIPLIAWLSLHTHAGIPVDPPHLANLSTISAGTCNIT